MRTPATVWVTQETDKDFSGAEAWGRVEFLTKDDLSNMKNSLKNEELINRIRFLLHRFGPDDWVVPAGSPYVAAVVFMVLGQMGVRKLNILRWDNRDLMYRPMQLDLTQHNRFTNPQH